MCGIVGAVSARNIVPVLVQGLQRLEYRGYDSCGVAVHGASLGNSPTAGLQRARSTARVSELLEQVKAGIDAVKSSGNPLQFFDAGQSKWLEQRTAAAGGIKTGKIHGVSDYIDEVIDSTAAMNAARVRAETAAGESLAKFMTLA